MIFAPVELGPWTALDEELRRRLVLEADTTEGAIDVEASVQEIIGTVRRHGDAALIELTERFDGLRLDVADLQVSPERVAKAAAEADETLRAAIDGMIDNVRRFHAPQRRQGYTVEGPHGTELTWRLRPVSAAAVYVPGGRAAYPTSLVMNVVPAQLAGVPRIIALSPPHSVDANPAVAYALQQLEIDAVYAVGGAQAVAAAAFGTETIDPVDVIVGPGNAYVAEAKRQVFGRVGIDSIAGPSEVVIVADAQAPPLWVMWDLLAQAEHDPEARSILLTPSRELAESVGEAIRAHLPALPRREIVEAALRQRALNGVVADLETAVALANRVAPEHLQVMVDAEAGLRPEDFVAGAIFWGPHSPTAVGDYWAGPNHVLPTGGTARFRGPLGVDDFLVPTSLVRYSAEAARTQLGPAVRLARAERLHAHAEALAARGRERGGS